MHTVSFFPLSLNLAGIGVQYPINTGRCVASALHLPYYVFDIRSAQRTWEPKSEEIVVVK